MSPAIIGGRIAKCATTLVVAALPYSPCAQAGTGPQPPQGPNSAPPGSPQNLGTVEVDLGDSLFVDDGHFCRYVTNGGPALPNNVISPASLNSPGTELILDIYDPSEWQSFRADPGEAEQQVCCRPAATADAFCAGGTVDGIGDVGGTGVSGYGQAGTFGTATAQCHDAYGTYTETHTYKCEVAGSGVSADGIWQLTANQGESCTSADTITYGACSTTGVGGWGNELVTVKDCFGNVISSSYNGPACYTTPPCTPSYSKSCSTSTATYTDVSCGTGSYTVPGGCSFVTEVVGGTSCSFSIPDYAPGGASPSSTSYTEFLDCGAPSFPNGDSWGNWGTTSGPGVSCSPNACSPAEPYFAFTNGVQTGSGHVCGINSTTCTYSGWQ